MLSTSLRNLDFDNVVSMIVREVPRIFSAGRAVACLGQNGGPRPGGHRQDESLPLPAGRTSLSAQPSGAGRSRRDCPPARALSPLQGRRLQGAHPDQPVRLLQGRPGRRSAKLRLHVRIAPCRPSARGAGLQGRTGSRSHQLQSQPRAAVPGGQVAGADRQPHRRRYAKGARDRDGGRDRQQPPATTGRTWSRWSTSTGSSRSTTLWVTRAATACSAISGGACYRRSG